MGLNMCFTWDWIGFMDGYGSSHWNGIFHFLKHKLAGCYMDVQCVSSPQKYGNSMYFILVIHLHFLFQSIMTLQQWIFRWKPPCSVDFPYKNLRFPRVRTLHRLMRSHGRSRSFRAGGREVAEDSLTHLAKNSGTPGKPGEYDILETLFGIALRVSVVYSIFLWFS